MMICLLAHSLLPFQISQCDYDGIVDISDKDCGIKHINSGGVDDDDDDDGDENDDKAMAVNVCLHRSQL